MDAEMDILTATMLADGGLEPESWEEFCRAHQKLIDTGVILSLQGSLQRTSQRLIDEGYCHAPTTEDE